MSRLSQALFFAAFAAAAPLSARAVALVKVEATKPTPTAQTQPTITEPAPTIDLSSMTKDELLAVATERNVKVAKSWTKAKILAALATV